MQIAFTYDLRDDYLNLGFSAEETAEFDSVETIDAIEKALTKMGHKVIRIGNIWNLTKALAKGESWHLVFNVCEGLQGLAREAQVPALLDAYNQPYVFSSPEALIVAHDKSLAKLKLAQAGLATASWQVFKNEVELTDLSLAFPVFLKPVAEGTGKGISAKSLIEKLDDFAPVLTELLERYNQPVLVEKYLSGREFTVGVIGNGAAAKAIGVMEIISKPGAEAGGHTYHNKENCEALMEYKLADDTTAIAAAKLAEDAWKILECRDAGRIDIRCDENGVPHFLEVNPLAGLHPTHSDLPILASQNGMDFQSLMENIIDSATKRIKLQPKKNISCV